MTSQAQFEKYSAVGDKFTGLGTHALRVSCAIILGWIGAMKFTAYEAGAIKGLAGSSPLTSWLYSFTSVQGVSNLIGSVEILFAILIILGAKFPKMALLGALGACATFAVTSSYLLTAGVTEKSLGFPALTVVPGQFLLKDLMLLSGAVFLVGEALKRMSMQANA